MKRLLLITFIGLGLLACGNSGETNMDDLSNIQDSMETLSRGTMGSPVSLETGNDGQIVISSQEQFEELWKQMHQGIGNDVDDVPEIDFDRFTVLGVFMGEMPSSGYSIRINEIILQDDGSLIAEVYRSEPGPTCMNLTVITYPHHIVKIPAYDREITFESTTFVEECE
ncbi:MAG: protease complex subunit PrcB family protein [Balneolia bacterium]|nr:protease complex subunit PrcB family protein [Balneolia bacterium]